MNFNFGPNTVTAPDTLHEGLVNLSYYLVFYDVSTINMLLTYEKTYTLMVRESVTRKWRKIHPHEKRPCVASLSQRYV